MPPSVVGVTGSAEKSSAPGITEVLFEESYENQDDAGKAPAPTDPEARSPRGHRGRHDLLDAFAAFGGIPLVAVWDNLGVEIVRNLGSLGYAFPLRVVDGGRLTLRLPETRGRRTRSAGWTRAGSEGGCWSSSDRRARSTGSVATCCQASGRAAHTLGTSPLTAPVRAAILPSVAQPVSVPEGARDGEVATRPDAGSSPHALLHT